jgi:hypothetical protein
MNARPPRTLLGALVFALAATACLPGPGSSGPQPVACGEPCVVGQRRCDPGGGSVVQECQFNVDGTGCFGHVQLEDCAAEGGACVPGREGEAECVVPTCAPTACVVGEAECVDEGTRRECVADASDPLGCGVLEERACAGDEVCEGGACVADCEAECVVGERVCAPDGALIECVDLEPTVGRACSELQTVEDCAAQPGGVCDAVAVACAMNGCPAQGLSECLPEGRRRECVAGPGGVLEWQAAQACTASQECIDGRCLCDDACDAVGDTRCADDGASILECVMEDGCLVERAQQACPEPTTCRANGDGDAECQCPEVVPGVSQDGMGCDPNGQDWSCQAPGETVRCLDVGACRVWQFTDECPDFSSGFECRPNGQLARCSPQTGFNGETCHRIEVRNCLLGRTCQADGMGGFACLL